MRVIECEQGSAQWLQERVGRITASRVCEAMSRFKSKGGETMERKNYRTDILVERLTGRSTENFQSPEMLWGSENEPYARNAYEMEREVMVDTVGFILHPKFDFSGASPDALVGTDGGLEIKCPKTATHIKWMLQSAQVPEEHQDQMLWNMACAERSWWDFVSFDPRLPDGINLFIVRMERDDKRIAEMEAEVVQFNDQVNDTAAFLRKRVKVRPAPPVDTRTSLEQLEAMMDRMEMIP